MDALSSSVAVVVFPGPTDFDKMVDELVNQYYMEGEKWLMQSGVKTALPRQLDAGGSNLRLDECFFVLQKCGLRAVATNQIHATCAIFHVISDLISNDLMTQGKVTNDSNT